MNHEDCARLAALAPSAALGALEPDDAAFVRRHLFSCAEPHPELRDAVALAAAIGGALPDEEIPSAGLRERVLGRARAGPATIVPLAIEPPGPGPWRRLAAGAGALATAAVLLLGVQLGANGALESQLDAARSELTAARSELTEAEAWIERAVANGATAFFMDGQGEAALASFMLVIEDDAAGAVLVMAGLPQIAADQTYELWVERAGEIVATGTFTPDARGLAALTIDGSVADVRAAMVTIEPAGGSERPSPDDIVMQGALSG